ncbi:YifB family Mg chelatase-like AAA ATPase [Candidatus Peregrinibacteria bacterium]|nr:YifB family Mg chelatase-like AAA ATPase [Candidatus Peregrinibacteria bacterium]
MHSKVLSAYTIGLDTQGVEVETDISAGLPCFSIVGLGDASILESRERVRSAIKNSAAEFPMTRKTVNLAPACVKKQGSIFDLAIAVGILSASKQVSSHYTNDSIFIGELALDGSVRKIDGVILIAEFVKKKKIKTLYLPEANAKEASYISEINIVPVKNLRELIEHLRHGNVLAEFRGTGVEKRDHRFAGRSGGDERGADSTNDLRNISGQEYAKRAIQISAAGGHNLLMIGPPGCGKTMLANAVQTILPGLEMNEALELTKIYSVAGMMRPGEALVETRPFREVHHTASSIAVLGGGNNLMPGEISLAHRGVLFFDELTLFPINVLESLRQPLESGHITIARARYRIMYPANFIFVGAMNPCPCGFFGDKSRPCICTENQIKLYRNKISGPLLDRIDLIVNMRRVPFSKTEIGAGLGGAESGAAANSTSSGGNAFGGAAGSGAESSAATSSEIFESVKMARESQKLRQKNLNRDLDLPGIRKFCGLSFDCRNFLRNAAERLNLSMRGSHKIIKISRTIADLENSKEIKLYHVTEAMQYRGNV